MAQGRAFLGFLDQRLGGRGRERKGLRRVLQRAKAGLRPRLSDPEAVHGEVLRELGGRQEGGASRRRGIGRGIQKNGQRPVHFLLTSALSSFRRHGAPRPPSARRIAFSTIRISRLSLPPNRRFWRLCPCA